MGMLPLVQDMPLRMTTTEYHGETRLYKHRDCVFRGFELEDDPPPGNEVVLSGHHSEMYATPKCM